MKRLTGAEFSLIYAGKRLITSLMDVYGKRMIDSGLPMPDDKSGEFDVMGLPQIFSREPVLKGKISESILLEISLPRSEYEELGRGVTNDFIIFGSFGILLVLMTGTILSWHIARPLTELAHFSTRIASGDLNLKVRSDREDEIGLLHSNFQKMIDGLLIERNQKESRMSELKTLFEISNAVNHITESE
ncbi:HAMP domain-containing protein, partial [bacterium]|nr:HAMP domain-containing protein [bacterium]